MKKLLILCILPIFAFAAHKYYISLTKVYYDQEEKSLQITMRFFIDDVQKTLDNRYETNLELATKNEDKKADFYLNKYITQKFKIKVNNELQNLNYLGKEYENDVVYFYLESKNIESIQSIEIQSTMLYEEFPDQENFVKLSVGTIKKTYILIKNSDKELLKLP